MSFSSDTIEELRVIQSNFAKERNWDQYHTPRNLLLALVGEVGELAEMFTNKEKMTNISDWSIDDKVHLGEELSDVFLYLMRLSEKCLIDLPVVTMKRIQENHNLESSNDIKSHMDQEPLEKRMKLENDFQFTKSTLESLRIPLAGIENGHISLQDIVLTMVTEVGQLAELFQWKGEVSDKIFKG